MEQEWSYLNGYDNDNIHINGELKSLEFFCKYYSTFIDVGANKGDFGKKIKELNSNIHLIMFEPHPILASKLSQKFPNADVNQVALSNKKSSGMLNVHSEQPETGSIYDRKYMMPNYTDKMQKISIDIDRLDSYENEIFKNIKDGKGIYIKIDAEGAEYPILQGSKEILSKDFTFFIHFEYSYGWKESNNTLYEAFHFLNRLNFQIFRITPLGIEKVKFYSTYLDNDRYCNYLTVKNFNFSTKGFKKHTIASRDGDTDFYEF